MKNTKNKAEQLIEQVDGFLDSGECRIHQDIDDAHALLRYIKRELIEISAEIESMKEDNAVRVEHVHAALRALDRCKEKNQNGSINEH